MPDVRYKGYTMLDMNYEGYTIKVRSQLLPHGTWEPRAIVQWREDNMNMGEPLASGELQVTEDLADAVALMLAKACVDKQKV
jgi:hypothetical protein